MSPIAQFTKPGEEPWPTIRPLPNDLPTVRAFDPSCLPATFGPWLADISERMQCAPDYPAAGALVALGSLIGRKVGIRPKRQDDWLVVPNLWGCIVGRPGLMKSPALEQALTPLRTLSAKALERHQTAMGQHMAEAMLEKQRAKLTEAKIAKLLSNEDTEGARNQARDAVANTVGKSPTLRRYEVNNTTVEKLGELLEQNPNGLLVFRDELVGFLRSLDKEGNEESRSFFLEAWNGTGSFIYDRIGRGTVRVDSNTVSIIGGIQPDLLASYIRGAVKGGMDADGLMQRFQVAVWPDSSKEWRNVDRWPDPKAKEDALSVFRYLDELTVETVEAESDGGIPFLRFTSEAQERFDAWRMGLEMALRNDAEHPAFEAHLAKYRKLVPSIALILHLADRKVGPVTLAAFEMALTWAAYLESHARRIYSAVLNSETMAAHELSRHLRRGALSERFTLREAYRKGWSGLGTKEETEPALETLCEMGWIRQVPPDAAATGRHPSPTFQVNPEILRTPLR